MRITLTSLMVDDQSKALRFYTEVLGFTKKHDIPVGEYRWITVTGDGRDEVELALEPKRQSCGQGVSGGDVRAGHPPGRVRSLRHSRGILTAHVARRRVHTRADTGWPGNDCRVLGHLRET
jgi:catechol 2,3-dioxygenase-like lactoylglutathione lyase family enzyme